LFGRHALLVEFSTISLDPRLSLLFLPSLLSLGWMGIPIIGIELLFAFPSEILDTGCSFKYQYYTILAMPSVPFILFVWLITLHETPAIRQLNT